RLQLRPALQFCRGGKGGSPADRGVRHPARLRPPMAGALRTVPGAVVLGSDFKALGLIRSLGRRGIPCVLVDDLPRAAWFSRFATRRFRWPGAMWGPAFVDFQFPVIVKPAVSIALQYAIGRKVLPAGSRRELLEQYQLAASVIEPRALMVQEIVPGDGRTQYSVAAFARDGRMVAAMTARRRRQYPLDYGLS